MYAVTHQDYGYQACGAACHGSSDWRIAIVPYCMIIIGFVILWYKSRR